MITVFSSVIHELTHAQAIIERLLREPQLEVLKYANSEAYSRTKIQETGGEVDAFSAEISAVIRYRVMTQSEYSAFNSSHRERYFDRFSGQLLDRQGLTASVSTSGGSMGYLIRYSEAFTQSVKNEYRYLKNAAAAVGTSDESRYIELHRRLELRINLLEERFQTILGR